MKNLVVTGDSFCANSSLWPAVVAKELDLNLICYTNGGGQPWWDARIWLQQLDPETIANTEIIIFAHTNAERVPTKNRNIGFIDHSKDPTNEIETAIHLYYKYIFDADFVNWAQEAWFSEISKTYGHKTLVHLHCFPWSMKRSHLLSGINVSPCLTALSLNELGAEKFALVNDIRPNHLNLHNNQQLGLQLSKIISSNQTGWQSLDTGKFHQKTTKWFDWD